MEIGSSEAVAPVVGRYRLLAELGHGGMARVFLAVAHGPSGFSKLVVLKMIRMHLIEDPETVQMFLDEARLAGRLNHPNVVHTHEVVEEDGRYGMVMEYLDGQSLSAVLKRAHAQKVSVPLAIQLRAVLDCLQGLHYAHTVKDYGGTPLSLVHRDVSPQNIFITYDGQIKVLDFGIAKAVTSSAETKAGVIKGKIAYMAPEQVLSEEVDGRADVFAVGAILWHVAAGQRLWKGLPDVQVISRVTRGDIPPPSSVRPDVPPELERITMKALAIERQDRYRDALELHDELERFVELTGAKASAREAGAFVSEMFQDVRAQIARTIETQLSKASCLDPSVYERAAIPAILTNSGPTTPAGSISGPLQPGAASVPAGMQPLLSGHDDLTTSSTRSNVGALANSIPRLAGRGSGKRAWFSLVAVFGVIAGLAAALFLVPTIRSMIVGAPGGGAVSAAPVLSSVSASPSASASEDQPRWVGITIETKPQTARIFFDDEELGTNPASQRVPKDGATHKVRVEAKGYESQTMDVVADKDTGVTMALDRADPVGESSVAAAHKPSEPEPVAVAPGAPSAAVPPAAKPKESSGSAGSTPPSARDRIKNLDKSNPWEP